MTFRQATACAAAAALVILALAARTGPSVQAQGMDLSQASGVPLPAPELAAGTVTVRVVRESFANNLANISVAFSIEGEARTVITDADGRAEVTGLPPGTTVQATAEVDGQRLVSQPAAVPASGGLRFVLVAGLGGDAGVGGSPASPVAGSVTIGRDSRIVAEFADERLNIYYVLQVVNPAGAPVDLGGPLVLDLPSGARSATVLPDSTVAATANGTRIIATGPFAPGVSALSVAFELPFGGDAAHLEQVWPVPVEQLTMFLLKDDGFDLTSPQFSTRQDAVDQGRALVIGLVPGLGAGQPLSVDITGLPHRPTWPRDIALALGGLVVLLGLWAAVVPARRSPQA